MGRLVGNTSKTADGLCDVGAWLVAEGDHDTSGVDQLAAGAGFVTGRTCYQGFVDYWHAWGAAGGSGCLDDLMAWQTIPVTPDRFEDFADVINRSRRATHCWCLSHRLTAGQIEELGRGSRERAARALCAREHPPGVVTYRDGIPVGWCSISPRAEIPRLARSALIRPVDDLPVWSIICVVVRSGHRRQGVTSALLEGAVAWAASEGAPAVEAYPVDPGEGRMDGTMAFVGTRRMFEKVGFEVIGTTEAVASKMPRLVMRRNLIAPSGP